MSMVCDVAEGRIRLWVQIVYNSLFSSIKNCLLFELLFHWQSYFNLSLSPIDACLSIDLVDIYTKQVRSILEFGVPVWNSGLTQEEVSDLERVQKSFLYVALGSDYVNYKSALVKANLDTLVNRRLKLCQKFALKSAKHPKHSNWFVKSDQGPNTRSIKEKYKTANYRLTRTRKGPIPYLTKLLNTM